MGEPEELADDRLALEREIEGGEALTRVPSAAERASPRARERMAVLGDVPEGFAAERGGREPVDRGCQPGRDHAC